MPALYDFSPYSSWSGSNNNNMFNFETVTPTAGAVGSKVGAIGTPDPYGDLSKVFPNLKGTNSQVSTDLNSELMGQLSPSTINAIQNYAATRGISGGMPGANIFQNLGARSIGATSEGLMQQGLKDYSNIIPSISGTQTVSPALQTQIAEQNAVNAAAPNPTEEASYSQQLFQNYMKAIQPASGGTGGYTTVTSPSSRSSGGTGQSGGVSGYSFGGGAYNTAPTSMSGYSGGGGAYNYGNEGGWGGWPNNTNEYDYASGLPAYGSTNSWDSAGNGNDGGFDIGSLFDQEFGY